MIEKHGSAHRWSYVGKIFRGSEIPYLILYECEIYLKQSGKLEGPSCAEYVYRKAFALLWASSDGAERVD